MDRAEIIKHLAEAERHVSDGAQRVIKQHRIVLRVTAALKDAGLATALLQQHKHTQTLHVAHRDQLLHELLRYTSRGDGRAIEAHATNGTVGRIVAAEPNRT